MATALNVEMSAFPKKSIVKYTLVAPCFHASSVPEYSRKWIMQHNPRTHDVLVSYGPVPSLTQESPAIGPDQRGIQLAGAYAPRGVTTKAVLSSYSQLCETMSPCLLTSVPSSSCCGSCFWRDYYASSYLLIQRLLSKACIYSRLLAQSNRDSNTNLELRRDRPKLGDITQKSEICLIAFGPLLSFDPIPVCLL